MNHGFLRVAAASPQVKVADCIYNVQEINKMIGQAEKEMVSAIVFPEMCITSYTCGDLFHQQLLLQAAESGLESIVSYTESKEIVVIVGLPLSVNNKLYNVAAIINNGKLLGFVPKTDLPNYNEFYDMRWFNPATKLDRDFVNFAGAKVPIGNNLLFSTTCFTFAVEICEDLWTPIPPSSIYALSGAEVIFNLSASNETIGKHNYRKSLITNQSARSICAYVYASAGCGESTTDLVFSGSCMVAENGALLAESDRFRFDSHMTICDIDIDRIRRDRMRNISFNDRLNPLDKKPIRIIDFNFSQANIETLKREINPKPFVPINDESINERCEEIFSIQTSGLMKRLLHTGIKNIVIGISGGLDSTLALLVAVRTFDRLNMSRKGIIGITMPGFGTTGRTYRNAIELMNNLGVTSIEISIKEAVLLHFKDIGHDKDKHDVTYENSQARERTQILMDYANQVNGLVIGTGDLSELALGWCTYNGDHMSMYAVNTGVPKTLVKTLVSWVSTQYMDNDSKTTLSDIVATPVSPELLPAGDNDEIIQITEDVVGPYELHDFFLYYVLRFGFSPAKIYYLACHAFNKIYDQPTILKWLKIFFKRFFSQQFKRSCLPDGPKVGSVNLSPRGDWRMPSDAAVDVWTAELSELR